MTNEVLNGGIILNYKIRKVKMGDESRLACIQVESWRAAYTDILSSDNLKKYLDVEYVTAIYKRLLENNKGNGYIMQVDEDDHCIAFWDRARNTDDTGVAEIICIHSLQNRWGQGYGSKMMKEILEDIEAQGYSQVILWVFEKNMRARLFYEANGFHKTDKSQPALGATEICYIKSLSH